MVFTGGSPGKSPAAVLVTSVDCFPMSSNPELILASGSPRRQAMLRELDITFRVRSADVDERPKVNEDPEVYARRLARDKAMTVAEREGQSVFVLGADTTVSVLGRIYGKPHSRDEAMEMLRELSGGEHRVTTGYALVAPGGKAVDGAVTTRVSMRSLSADEIRWYVDTGEPFDKAGGYAIQGKAAHFVTEVHGSVSNVIGLPLSEVVLLLRMFGLPAALPGVPA